MFSKIRNLLRKGPKTVRRAGEIVDAAEKKSKIKADKLKLHVPKKELRAKTKSLLAKAKLERQQKSSAVLSDEEVQETTEVPVPIRIKKPRSKLKFSLPQIGVVFLLIALALQLGILGRNTYISANADTIDWGMSFQEDNKPPVGNSTKEFLLQYNAYYLGDESRPVVYLTFDAGYENGHSTEILDALKKHNVKAAFFLVKHYIDTNPDIVKRMVEEGHIVANHTTTHPDMTKLSAAEFKKELDDCAASFKAATGSDMAMFYRPPSGKYSEGSLEEAEKLGYTTILWSSAYADWDNNKQPSPDAAIKTLMPRTHPGAIVLLHLTSATNGQIMDEYLTRLEKMGYTFETLDQLKAWSVQ